MVLSGLSDRDRELVRRCLAAAAGGLYEEDTHAVIGLDRAKLDAVLRKWPDIEGDPNWEVAISNSLVNAWGYPLDAAEVEQWFGVPREEIRRVHHECNRLLGRPAGGRYFENLR